MQSVLDRNTDSRTISFNQTFQSGIYELDWEKSASEKTLYAVNVSPQESDLKHIGSQLIPPQYFRKQAGTPSVLNELSAERASHTGLSENLLFTVLALIVVEQLLLWRFSVGALSFLTVMFLCCLSFFFQR